MNKKIQPKYYKAKVICSTCGNKFEVGSTKEEIKVDTCSNCHQFYTGAQSKVQATGRVEMFNKKFEAGTKAQKELDKRNKVREEKRKEKEAKEKKQTKKRDK